MGTKNILELFGKFVFNLEINHILISFMQLLENFCQHGRGKMPRFQILQMWATLG